MTIFKLNIENSYKCLKLCFDWIYYNNIGPRKRVSIYHSKKARMESIIARIFNS